MHELQRDGVTGSCLQIKSATDLLLLWTSLSCITIPSCRCVLFTSPHTRACNQWLQTSVGSNPRKLTNSVHIVMHRNVH